MGDPGGQERQQAEQDLFSGRKRPGEDLELSAPELLELQEELEQEAALKYPGRVDQCTYEKGYATQQLYLCLTCQEAMGERDEVKLRPGAVCYACSVMCHTEHDLVELFERRHFRCDCGNACFPPDGPGCSLTPTKVPFNEENDTRTSRHNFFGRFCSCDTPYPETETRTMFACALCQDWFHDSCLGQVPPLEDFEELVCGPCATRVGWTGPMGPKEGEPESLAHPVLHSVLSLLEPGDCQSNEAGHLFLREGWRTRLCTCPTCQEVLASQGTEHLLREDPILEPEPEEEGTSLYETASRALERLDRVAVLEGLYAFNDLKDKLTAYLKPFAETRRVVTREDIVHFFEQLASHKRPGPSISPSKCPP